MNRTLAIVLAVLGVGLVGGSAATAQPGRLLRIGALTESWGPTPIIVGFRDGLQELGHRENEHFEIGVRFTQGDLAALPAAARELVQHGADILFASGTHAAMAARTATDRIPIVFVGSSNPVEVGLVQSFARPGSNVTGVVDLDIELIPKRLELFKEIIPGLRRVLFPYDVADAYVVSKMSVYRDAARRLGVLLVDKPLRTQDEAGLIILGLRKGDVEGILSSRFVSLNIPGFVLEAATKRSIPTMFHDIWYVERGGLASYSANAYLSGRQAARLADKIIRGMKPADVPVEQPTHFELVINLKTVRALGLTIPPSVLQRADRVIE